MDRNVYEILLEKLKDSNLIEYFDVSSVTTPVDIQAAIKLAKTPVNIFVEDGNLCYKNENQDVIECPNLDTNVSDAGYWLSDKIPAPSFDVQQGGNVRKAEEAESCYICCVIAAILKDPAFYNELEDFIRSYDFDKMSGVEDSKTFVLLLREWMDLQSIVINVIVSATKYAISDQKKRLRTVLEEWARRSGARRIARPRVGY